MREIEFRAFYNSRMYSVAKFDFWGSPDQATCDLAGKNAAGEHEELFDIYIHEVILMQYTGLFDKNGANIFEGDIVRGTRYDDLEHVGEVVYEDGGFALSTGYMTTHAWPDYKLEIIGNIHENPELLEVEE